MVVLRQRLPAEGEVSSDAEVKEVKEPVQKLGSHRMAKFPFLETHNTKISFLEHASCGIFK